jgi:Dyp-type peroxidase family
VPAHQLLMPIKLSQTRLDIQDSSLQGLFADLQGNILKAHGRDHSRHIFLRFTAGAGPCRDWVASFAKQVTSTIEQHRTARDYHATGTEHLFSGFMLSFAGYQALEIDDRQIPDDKAFRAGMKDHDAVYDTGPKGVHQRSMNPMNDDLGLWEEPFLTRIDALVVLAYGGSDCDLRDCAEKFDSEIERIKTDLAGIAEVLSVQSGFALRNEYGHVIEHFGYADGVSNPLFMQSDIEVAEKAGAKHYDASAPFGLVGVQDPGGQSPTDSFGTYFVYRKLEQNVKGFNNRLDMLASALSAAGGRQVDRERAGSLVIGRFKDGTPVSLQAEPGLRACNDFGYDDDGDGSQCPFQAHIRKTNPRGDTFRVSGVPMPIERSKRIVRRGISFGSTDLDPATEWSGAGLLFLSCQSDIEQQFLVAQGGWANNPEFLHKGTGLDPIIGQPGADEEPPEQHWPVGDGGQGHFIDFSFSGFIRCRGGEFFFAPSISFLRSLSPDTTGTH